MSILDALPGIAAGAFGGLFRDAVLTRGAAKVSDGRGGFMSVGTTTQACKAIVDTFSDIRRAAAGIPDSDRKITVLGATLGGLIPADGDRINVEGRDWTVVGVGRDPAAATYELQAR